MIIKFEKYMLPNRFQVTQRSPKHPKVDDQNKSGFYFSLGASATLFVLLILALVYQDFEKEITAPYVPQDFVLVVEDIPETKQQNNPPPPPKMPAVPVESEEVIEMLEEIEFEIESLDFFDIPPMPVLDTGPVGVSIGPRQIIEKWPAYPDSEKNKGHVGVIDMRILVDERGNVVDTEILRNTTGSKLLEQISIEAAIGCKFQPARDGKNNPIPVWTSKQYTFSVKN
ncbi:TonB family protein [candidate division KSB1 bacterium]|nr:TonB family protein [candidate division KSB1 bacterium]